MNSDNSASSVDVREESLIDLAQQLVRCASAAPGDELERSFMLVSRYLQGRGVATDLIRVREDMPIMRCTVRGQGDGPHLLFQGHLDVVAEGEGWDFDPFGGEIVDGMLRGRGSCDMKGGVAACVEAVCQLAEGSEQWDGSVTLLVVPDEETGGERGLLPYLSRFGLPGIDAGVCAEPTDLHPYLGNRGVIWAYLRVTGRAAHAAFPHLGRNPVPVGAAFVTSVLQAEWSGQPPTPTSFVAGDEINTIPGGAMIGLDLRLSPSDDARLAITELEQLVERFRERYPEHGVQLEVKKLWPPCAVDEESALAQRALQSARLADAAAHFGFDDAANDASFLSEAGVPTLVWGPGTPGLAHALNEQADVRQIIAAAKMYVRFTKLMADNDAHA